jgi:hypothetical protein
LDLTIGWKKILIAAGTGCIFWGYYHLFAVDPGKAMIDKTVTALTLKGEVSGRVIAFNYGTVFVAKDGGVVEVPELTIVKIDNTSLFNYETGRAVMAVCTSVSGGIIVWIAMFFL